MADDAKLLAVVEANTKQFENALRRLERTTDASFRRQQQSVQNLDQTLTKVSRTATSVGVAINRNVTNSFTALGAALGVREIARYADAWTVAGNKIAAAGQITGRQTRSLSEINDIARETRTGITATADLYAKLLRSTGNVAKSEEDVARATKIVNEAFKAGGAAVSEQAAGILQLGQALGSGILQGDELRSVRENAPLLAKAIADEFKTNIAGLKALGAAGELTAERVFKAILAAQKEIEATFATTVPTIGDSITILSNSFTEFIGKLNAVAGVTKDLTGLFNLLSSSLDKISDLSDTTNLQIGGQGAEFSERLKGLLLDTDLGIERMRKFGEATATTESRLQEGADAAAKMFDAINKSPEMQRLVTKDQVEELGRITDLLGKKTPEAVDEAIDALKKLAAINPRFQGLLDQILEVAAGLQRVKDNAVAAGIATSNMGVGATHEAAAARAYAEHQAKEQFIAERDRLLSESDANKEMDKRVDDILKAADKAGVALSDAAARIQAASEIASEHLLKQTTAVASDAAALIRDVEGFIGTSKYDVNHERVGYSSDTLTSPSGEITEVRKGDTTTVADAERDLTRRIKEIQLVILQNIGDAAYKALPSGALAAVTSVGYQYGAHGIPKSVMNAAAGGNAVDVSNAVLALPGTPSRHRKEAETALTGAPGGEAALAALKAQNDLLDDQKKKTADLAEAKQELIAGAEQQIAALGLEAKSFGQTTFEAEKAKVAFDLLNQAKAAGIPITDDLKAKIDELSSAMASGTVAVDDAQKKQKDFEDAQSTAVSKMDEFRSFSSGVLSGFIQDLIHGKSAAEALADAVGKIADKLIDIAVDNLISSLFGKQGTAGPSGGTGGGGIGGIFGSILGAVLHSGGVVKSSGGAKRAVSSSVFAGAPRYHSGGVAGLRAGEVPAILRAGEVVMPSIPGLSSMPKQGGAQRSVDVNNTIKVEPSPLFVATVDSRAREAEENALRRMPSTLEDRKRRSAGGRAGA